MSGTSEGVAKGWLSRPRFDPQKAKEYADAYRKSEKGAAIIKASKRRSWEKLKADPVRYDNFLRKRREDARLRRLGNERSQEEVTEQRRRAARTRWEKHNELKAMKPLDVTLPPKVSKPWMRDRYKPLFVENKNTVKRGRPRKKKPVRPHCDHNQGFKFQMTEVGMKRTCNACGHSFIEVARR